MTDIEKAYLKYNGYSDLEIENWEEEGEFDIQKEQSYKDFVKVFKLGQQNAISLYEDEMNNMNSDYCNRIKKLQIENEELKKQIEKSISDNARLKLATCGWLVCDTGYDKALEEQKQVYREELNNL